MDFLLVLQIIGLQWWATKSIHTLNFSILTRGEFHTFLNFFLIHLDRDKAILNLEEDDLSTFLPSLFTLHLLNVLIVEKLVVEYYNDRERRGHYIDHRPWR